ncbi:DUF4350 domain-containing protein [Arthrobacter tecti]
MGGTTMSGTTTAPHAPAGRPRDAEVIGDGGSVRRTVTNHLSRARPWLILGALLVISVIIGALVATSNDGTPLSPGNPAPQGAQATAEVLKRSGIEVIPATTLEQAQDALDGPGDTLLLHDPNGWLGSDQLADLAAGLADRVVLVEPSLPILQELAPGIRSAGVVPETVTEPLAAECANTDAQAAESISPGGRTYRGDITCFPIPPGGDAEAGGTFAATAGGEVLVIGNGAVLSNELADEHGNAALSLRTLGSTPTLVWYQPTAEDVPAAAGPVNPLSLLPAFVNPLMFWLLVTALLAILWRGRRLGPLVTEPLPVVVRSAETAAGRARLYQDANAVEHAADTLRAGTLNRLAAILRVPQSGSRFEVVAAAARKSGRDHQDVDRILNTFTPRSDAQLVRWSQELEDLEQEIRRA